jgi:hypothetical protein
LAVDCKIVTTIDYCINEKFYRTLSEATPLITQKNSVMKKEYFTICLFVSDYKTDINKNANVEFDIQVIDPNGKVYFEKQNARAVCTTVPNPSILMSETYIKICFEPEDKFGDYFIKIRLKDKIANESKDFKSMIKLVPFEYRKYFDDDKSFSKWMNFYYRSPSPEKAIDAYLYYAQSKLNESKSGFFPVFSFFLEIFKNNSYLYPYLIDLYKSQNTKTKIYILYLLRYGNCDFGNFANNLSKEENALYQKLLTEQVPNPYGEINNPSQLDMLWGEFLANGSYKPIKRIVETLELAKYKGYVEKYKNSNKTEDDRMKAYYDAIYQAAKWSLKSNCSQHMLVNDYCNYLYNNETLSETIRLELKEILGQ